MAAIARTIGAAFCLDNHFSEAGSWPARPNAALQVVGTVLHRNTDRPNAVLQVSGTVFIRNTARPNAELQVCSTVFHRNTFGCILESNARNPTTLHNVIK